MTPGLEGLDWDLIRVLLAALRSTSLRQAALALGVTHPTARRRLAELEQRLGFALFERDREGLHPTAQAAQLLAAAESVERASLGFSRAASALDPELRGPIRVTLPEILATDLLMADIADFARRWPELDIHLEPTTELKDLGRRQADVAIRMVPHGTSPDEKLAGRLAATSFRAVYVAKDASKLLASKPGSSKPGSSKLGRRHSPRHSADAPAAGAGTATAEPSWIGWRGRELDAAWVKQSEFPSRPVRGALNDVALQRAACAAGLGMSQLPCFYADTCLARITEPEPGFDIWVLVHEDLRASPRLRVFRDVIVDALRAHRSRLEGKG